MATCRYEERRYRRWRRTERKKCLKWRCKITVTSAARIATFVVPKKLQYSCKMVIVDAVAQRLLGTRFFWIYLLSLLLCDCGHKCKILFFPPAQSCVIRAWRTLILPCRRLLRRFRGGCVDMMLADVPFLQRSPGPFVSPFVETSLDLPRRLTDLSAKAAKTRWFSCSGNTSLPRKSRERFGKVRCFWVIILAGAGAFARCDKMRQHCFPAFSLAQASWISPRARLVKFQTLKKRYRRLDEHLNLDILVYCSGL